MGNEWLRLIDAHLFTKGRKEEEVEEEDGGGGCNYDSLRSLRLVFTLNLLADMFVASLLLLHLLLLSHLRQPLISREQRRLV